MKETPFPLIEKPVGAITYEHTIALKLWEDIFTGDSERNYYVDSRHEINLCAHYNVRTPGTFIFNSEYQYYVTDGRMSLTLHHSLGIPDDDMVIEKYQCLEDAKQSKYYKDFCDLKANIDKWIRDRKKLGRFPTGGIRCASSGRTNSRRFYEKYIEDTDEFVQLFITEGSGVWEMSKCYNEIGDLIAYIPEFEELNEKDLHFTRPVNMNDVMKDHDSPYYKFFEEVREIRSRPDPFGFW